MSHLNRAHPMQRTRDLHAGATSGFVFTFFGAMLLAAGLLGAPGTVGAQEPGEEKTIEFEGDVIEPGNDELARRIGIAENKIDIYLGQSRTSAKEGLKSAFDDFAVWFPEYNERNDPPGVRLIKELLLETVEVAFIGLPATRGAVDSFASDVRNAMSRELSDSDRRLGDTETFLAELERKYNRWILKKGLKVYDEFQKDPIFHGAVDRYVENFERFTMTSGSVRDNGPLRRMMENLGILGPGVETQRKHHECGLFLLVKHAVLAGHEDVGLTGGEPEWEFLGLDLDTYVRVEQIGAYDYIDWKSPYDICRDAGSL